MAITGTSGDDSLPGTTGADIFDLTQGGDDTADGDLGDDEFMLGAAFTGGDHLSGGGGVDTLDLDGDYSAGLAIGGASLNGFENLSLAGGHSYSLTLTDDAVATSADQSYFNVDASGLGAGERLIFDGQAETDTRLNLHGGAGGDFLVGGEAADNFDLFAGGSDTCAGGDGDDIFNFSGPGAFDRGDHCNGGAGFDVLSLDGNYSVNFSAKTMVGIERIDVFLFHSYGLKLNDANVDAGQTLTVAAVAPDAANTLQFNGKAEKDGHLIVTGGLSDDRIVGGGLEDTLAGSAGKDHLLGKGGADRLLGGLDADVLSGGSGADLFVFATLADSKVGHEDLITDLAKADVIDLSAIDADSTVAGDQAFTLVSVFSGHAGEAALSFDGDTGRTTLALDVDGDGQADSAIEMTGDQTGHHAFAL